MNLSFIGLGNIGGGAAANLARAGYEIRVADLDESKVARLVALGATAADSAAEVVECADVVFTSLPGPEQIAAVGSEILSNLRPGTTWVEMSTNDLATAQRLGQRAKAKGVSFVDAPVSGGPEGAEAGTLSVFVGGDVAAVDTVLPLLEVVGDKIDHLGPIGAGIVAKIAQVTLCYTQTVTLIEALLLGVKGGVEPSKMLDLIRNSAGTSYSAEAYGPEILAGTYDRSFPIAHAAKDLRLATEMAEALRTELPFTTMVADLYHEAKDEFGPDAAHCLAVQLLERRNGMILHEHLGDTHG